MEETTAAVVGFYPAFPPLLFPYFSPASLHFTFPPPLSLSIPACPCSKCTYCPRFPLHWLSQAVPHEDLFTRGKEKKNVCVTVTTPCQCIVFQYRKKCNLFEDCFCCCKKHKLLSVCQDLHPKRNYYYGVGSFFFFFCNNLSFLNDFLTDRRGLSYINFFWAKKKKKNSMAFWRKCWKYYDEFILLKMCTYLLLFLYLLIIFPLFLNTS